MADREYGFRTRAIHAGNIPDPVTGARALPIYQTSAFVFDDTADAAARFALQKYGNIYSRLANPTVAVVRGAHRQPRGRPRRGRHRQRAERAVHHLRLPGRRRRPHRRVGQPLRRVDHAAGCDAAPVRRRDHVRPERRPADYAAAITDKTKLIFAETIANPSGEIADIEGLAEVAHAAGIPLIIDSTIATPYLNRPIEWGADVVIHSATKFLGGHGTTLGGVVVESGRFDWHSEKFPLFGQPVPSYGGLQWSGNFGEYAFLTRLRAEQLRDIGPVARAALGVPAGAGRGDAALPHPGARRQRASRRRMAGCGPAHRVGVLGGSARASAPRPRAEVPAEGRRAASSASW